MALTSSYFFNFSTFSHSALFQNDPPPWSILPRLSAYLRTLPLGLHKGVISPQAYLICPEQISIGEGSVVEPGACIQGPCVIGAYCRVLHGAYVRECVLTGDHCVIGHDSEIKCAILLNKAHAAHFAYVGDSILGNEVNLGAGVKCANLKLDRTPITLHLRGQSIATGMRKLGAIVGDKTQIGCNAVLNPGALLGQEVFCSPCLNVGGFIPSRSTIKPVMGPSIASREHS